MIAHIRGRLIEKNTTSVVIECQGIGYDINISLTSFEQLPKNEEVSLFIHLLIREDAHSLYGFCTKLERDIFRQLISVSGIGANTARTILSFMNPQQIIEAIALGDITSIQSVKGIGLKTAQRVIIDLKDKVNKLYDGTEETSYKTNITNKNEVISALEVLGYPRKQTEKTIEKIIKENSDYTVEQIIKHILKRI